MYKRKHFIAAGNSKSKVLFTINELEEKIIKGNRKFVYWQNNCEETPDMKYIEPLLTDLSDIHEDMMWDRKKSRKQVVVPALRKPSDQAWGATVDSLEKDYVCLVTFDDETKPEFKITEPQSRQKDLWEDHYQTFNFLRRMLGIAHNTNKKRERQNNPEIEMIESQFLTFLAASQASSILYSFISLFLR